MTKKFERIKYVHGLHSNQDINENHYTKYKSKSRSITTRKMIVLGKGWF